MRKRPSLWFSREGTAALPLLLAIALTTSACQKKRATPTESSEKSMVVVDDVGQTETLIINELLEIKSPPTGDRVWYGVCFLSSTITLAEKAKRLAKLKSKDVFAKELEATLAAQVNGAAQEGQQDGGTPGSDADSLSRTLDASTDSYYTLAVHMPSLKAVLPASQNHPIHPPGLEAYSDRLFREKLDEWSKYFIAQGEENATARAIPFLTGAIGSGLILPSVFAASMGPVGIAVGAGVAALYLLPAKSMQRSLEREARYKKRAELAQGMFQAGGALMRTLKTNADAAGLGEIETLPVGLKKARDLEKYLGVALKGYMSIARSDLQILKLENEKDPFALELARQIEILAADIGAKPPKDGRLGKFAQVDWFSGDTCPQDATDSLAIQQFLSAP